MADDSRFDTGGTWRVVVAKAYDTGNPEEGAEESVVVDGPEAEARRVFSDTVATAAEGGYLYVRLRSGDRDVESWPPMTGWTV